MYEFVIEPEADTQRKERQGTRQGERERKRNMGCCVLLSVVHSPPPPTTSPPPCAPFHLPVARVIRTSGTGESPRPPPPHHTLTLFGQLEAAADL
jgi:hypothetical protein